MSEDDTTETVYAVHDYYIIEWVGGNKYIFLPTPFQRLSRGSFLLIVIIFVLHNVAFINYVILLYFFHLK